MKRRLFIIAVFLLLGAVVNVAVAWGCAAFVPGTWTVTEVGRDDPRARDLVGSKRPDTVLVLEGSGYGHETLLVGGYDSLRLTGNSTTLPSTSARAESQHTNRAGLPLRCLVGRLNWVSTGSEESEEYVGAWPVPRQVGPLKTNGLGLLPLRPIWPGFAVNTLFYATLLWLLICAPLALRRFLRVRRGLCPKCAYPMGESTVCTECGKALVKHAMA